MKDRFNGYKRVGNRVSLLDISRYCGLAPKLSEKGGVGRAAEVSGTFHAMASAQTPAEQAEALARFARLNANEQAQVQGWKLPTDTEVQPGTVLRYSEAKKEVLVGLDHGGSYRDPTKYDVLLRGYIDFVWVVPIETPFGDMRVAYVGDLKKSKFSSSGPDTLQTAAYGFAMSGLYGADAFCTGLWYLEDGQWDWSDRFIEFGTDEAVDLWASVKAAAENTDDKAIMGDHCRDCWGRLRCDSWALAASLGGTELKALVAGATLEPEALAQAAWQASQMKKLGEEALKRVQDMAYNGNLSRLRYNGSVYTQSWREGNEYVNVATLREKLGDEAERHIKRGKSYARWDWRKA